MGWWSIHSIFEVRARLIHSFIACEWKSLELLMYMYIKKSGNHETWYVRIAAQGRWKGMSGSWDAVSSCASASFFLCVFFSLLLFFDKSYTCMRSLANSLTTSRKLQETGGETDWEQVAWQVPDNLWSGSLLFIYLTHRCPCIPTGRLVCLSTNLQWCSCFHKMWWVDLPTPNLLQYSCFCHRKRDVWLWGWCFWIIILVILWKECEVEHCIYCA